MDQAGAGLTSASEPMTFDLHSVSTQIHDFTELIVNLHVLALLIINVTKTPARAFDSAESYNSLGRIYRLIELLAGLVTPLAKK